MDFAFDLWSYDDVKANATLILERRRRGHHALRRVLARGQDPGFSLLDRRGLPAVDPVWLGGMAGRTSGVSVCQLCHLCHLCQLCQLRRSKPPFSLATPTNRARRALGVVHRWRSWSPRCRPGRRSRRRGNPFARTAGEPGSGGRPTGSLLDTPLPAPASREHRVTRSPYPLPRASAATPMESSRDIDRHEAPARVLGPEQAVPGRAESLSIHEGDDRRIAGASPAVEIATDVGDGESSLSSQRTHPVIHGRRFPAHVP